MQSTQRTRLQTKPFVRGINNLLKLDVCGSRNQVEDDVEQVRASFLHSPKKSTVTASKELSMSKTTVWRVLHKHLVFKPYCIQMVQQLSDEDHLCLLDFCLQLQDLKSSDDHFLVKVQFSDEATFHVSSAVNWHNVRIWGSENPHAMWSINMTLLQSMCFVQSQVKKCTVHSLLKKPLLAWPIWTCCSCCISHSCKTYWRSYASKVEVPPTSTVRFVSTWTQCYQDIG